jgi:molybdopterin-containing oxidoreductase family iron-sulfur binding subunit
MDSDHGVKGKCGAEPSRRPDAGAPLDLEALREKLRQKRGPELWRSLDELAETPEFEEMLHREFPRHASEWPEGVSRRSFLQLASASLALAGLTGCTKQPIEKIVPYVKKPEQIIPGKPLFYATALTHGGYATGVLAESHMGRPTKIEGNPDHPASLGATDIFAQAAVLSLYDPARSQTISRAGRAATWEAFSAELNAALIAQQALGGAGIRLLTGTVTSPTIADQVQQIRTRFPNLRWHRWEPAGDRQSFVASMRAFGRPVDIRYDFSQADVVLAIDSETLTQGPGSVRYQRDFASRRRVRANQPEQPLSRVYCVESQATSTSTVSDHRLQLPLAEVEAFVLALAQRLGVAGGAPVAFPAEVLKKAEPWLAAVAADLQAAPGRSLIVGDEYLSPDLQVLIHGINQRLGNVGTTVLYSEPVEVDPVDPLVSLRDLVVDMNAGRVEMLLMLGVNPVYSAPADFGFAAALGKVPLRIHHGLYEDETSAYCHWHIPAAHELESWSDARSFDGTVSIIQPLIEPLFEGRSAHEILAVLHNQPATAGYDLVRQLWQRRLAGDFERAWRQALHDGLLPNTQAAPAGVAAAGGAVQQAAGAVAAAVQKAREDQARDPQRVTLCFRPDPTIWDGRYATNVWLQELPKPITKLVWDNALVVGPKTAADLGVGHEEPVEVTWKGRKLRAAAWVQPGVARGVASLSLGYGRERAGEQASGLGFNAYALRTSDALWTAPGAEVRGLGGRYVFACTQNHHTLESGVQGISEKGELSADSEMRLASEEAQKRHIIRVGTLREMREDPDFIKKDREKPAADLTMYPPYDYKGKHAWGMAIDLNVCTGCSSCVVACQAENNIPVVGKEQVMRGREMHWLRIDRYFYGDLDEPAIHNQPVPCMHCENAPCEVVCPVAATSHSDEGLNDMVYNRCVGTRYCSNNCPYKVRRFNFLRFSERESPLYRMLYNPDVTVRMRGVMEKCTYCVQRIEQAKIESKVESQPIPPNRLQTACQQACPTQAIAFGDINDGEWDVTRWKDDPLNYGLLEELNTRPRTTYLAKVLNKNATIEKMERAAAERERTEHGHS